MFSMHALHVLDACHVENMALNPKTGIESNTRKTWNRDLDRENAILEVQKVRMAGAKMDLPTLVFSPKHMFTYRQSAIKRRTAYSP